ncbi:uridine kinase, partial [Candidatus Poribacteria bacterium]|nr:uridine kinase [Candidatus Poribacteria bacterium]
LIFWSEDLRDLMDIKVFLDVDAHERVLRRMLRDVAQRGGDLEWAINWYRRDVLPNFPVYTEPCKQYADLIIPFQNDNPVALQTLVAGIQRRIQESRTSS